MSARAEWLIVTSEYPPDLGGVAGYTARIAGELARRGHAVRVIAPPPRDAGAAREAGAAAVTQLPDAFGPRGLPALRAALRAAGPRTIVLLQYVPHGFGWRGMNRALTLGLRAARLPRLWVMFHELAFGAAPGAPLRQRALQVVQRAMLADLVAAANRCFVSIEAWGRDPVFARRPAAWAPVPANVPEGALPRAEGATPVVGHFGTYEASIAAQLEPALAALLQADARLHAVLTGRGSTEFAQRFAAVHPGLVPRVEARGTEPEAQLARTLAATDVLLYPFADGISTRRTSAMAALAVGRAVVATDGRLTDAIWRRGGGLALVPAGDVPRLVAETQALLADSTRRAALARAGHALYMGEFSLARAVDRLEAAVVEAR